MNLTAAALRGIEETVLAAGLRPPTYDELADAAAREVLAEVTAALVTEYRIDDGPGSRSPRLTAYMLVAKRLGIDLDAALSTPPAPTEEV